MTTDRPAAPPRSTALAERPAIPGRHQSAPPADAFSALLGAAAPKPEPHAPRDAPRHRDGAPHAERPSAKDAAPEPAAATAADAAEPKGQDAPARLVTPDVFAAQLASPLPAATTAPAAPTAPVAAPVETPVLATFAPATPAVAATAPRLPQAAAAAASATEPAAAAAAAATTPELPVLSGLTPASALKTQTPGEPAVPTQQPPAAAPATAPAAATPKAPAHDAAPVAVPANAQPAAEPQPGEQPAAPAPAAAQPKPAEAPAAAPAAPPTAGPVGAPAPAAAPAAPSGLERAVPLYRAVETTGLLLQVATHRGVTHARLNLKPAELGGIEVRLQTTPQGVNAQLVADSPDAARMLSQASDDLRRQLEARDVTLLSLDVSTSSDQQRNGSAAQFGGGFGERHHHGGGHTRYGNSGPDHGAEVPMPAETSLVLPNGVLVDVLA